MSVKILAPGVGGVGITKSLRPTQTETASGCPRDFIGNRFVYIVVSPRARGLSIGLNLNPDKQCNFDCIYCEEDRTLPSNETTLDVQVMISELEKTLTMAKNGGIKSLPGYSRFGDDLLELRHVALSGSGEPTLCPQFNELVHAVVHIRARSTFPFFKLVLITNGSGLDLQPVQEGLRYFTQEDEVWIKLDVGSQAAMDRVNKSTTPLEKIVDNIFLLGRKRPVVIQSLFPMINGLEPIQEDINDYVNLLNRLKSGGANISLVQVYSATRPSAHSQCGHLSLKCLARICQRVRDETGLKAEVF